MLTVLTSRVALAKSENEKTATQGCFFLKLDDAVAKVVDVKCIKCKRLDNRGAEHHEQGR